MKAKHRSHKPSKKSKHSSKSNTSVKRTYIILWWMNHAPMISEFDSRTKASSAAHIRNATFLCIEGKVIDAFDWWRRDEQGNPMPFEWRTLY